MLWTIIPLAAVMAGSDEFQPTYTEISWKDSTLLVEPQGMNTGKVVRIISTNPLRYLDPEIQPGNIINLTN